MKVYFEIMKKNSYNKNIFYWIQICLDCMKIHFYITKKSDITKMCFIKYKIILIK